MRRSVARLRGLGFILWHTRHYFYHILLGLVVAWYFRELWHRFSTRIITVSLIGSVIPDLDHLIYFVTYGKKDWYTKQIRTFLRDHEWRTLWVFVAKGHKYNTDLLTHNYFFMAFLFAVATLSFFFDWKTSVVLFSSMLTHYLFDVFDDLVTLGYINPNWKRLGKPRHAHR